MGLIDKWLRKYQDDWCRECKCAMEKLRKQLFALPNMTVGHYVEHKDAAYYRKNLRVVGKRRISRRACTPAGPSSTAAPSAPGG